MPADDPGSLGVALRLWLSDESLRSRLRRAARDRRTLLAGWSATTGQVARVLGEVAA